MKKFRTDTFGTIVDLTGVKVGDVFIEKSRRVNTLRKVDCTRVTKTQCTIGGVRYSVLTARPIGADRFTAVEQLQHFEQHNLDEYEKRVTIHSLRGQIKAFKYDGVSQDKILKIAEILGLTK